MGKNETKGITLIELLAVIVILAVVAIIAVPIVLNIIEKSKLGALQDSAYGLIEAGTLYHAQYQNKTNDRFDIENNKLMNNNLEHQLLFKGNIKSGTVVIRKDGKVTVCVSDGKNSAYKNYNEQKVKIVTNEKCYIRGNSSVVYLGNNSTTSEYDNKELTEIVIRLEEKYDSILDKTYPVGSLYMSVDSTSPADLFGGTWVKIEDRFILSSGSTYEVGATGGEAEHTLTVDEIPSHAHTRGSMNITGSFSGGFYGESFSAGGALYASGGQYKNGFQSAWIGGKGGFGFDASRSWSGATSSVGGSQPHNNMPPYYVVNVWRRTE